jgi:hypothetical protein
VSEQRKIHLKTCKSTLYTFFNPYFSELSLQKGTESGGKTGFMFFFALME